MSPPGGADSIEALGGGTVRLSAGASRFDVQIYRPEKRNALSPVVIEALHEVLDRVEAEKPAVVVLRGVPGCFSAGADIAFYQNATARKKELEVFTHRSRDLCTRLTTVQSVVVAVVDGIAMGGGFELVLASDLVVASASSKFALPEVRLGLIPGWGGTQRLVHFLGPNRAKELIATGAAMSASAAYGFGIVTKLGPVAGSADDVADSYIDTLVDRAPLALRAIKTTVTAAYDSPAGGTVGAALETKCVLELLASADGIEGVQAFIAKREPLFFGH